MSIQANARSIGILLLALVSLVAGYAGWYHLEGNRCYVAPTPPGDPFRRHAPLIVRQFNRTWKLYVFAPAGFAERVITGTEVELEERDRNGL